MRAIYKKHASRLRFRLDNKFAYFCGCRVKPKKQNSENAIYSLISRIASIAYIIVVWTIIAKYVVYIGLQRSGLCLFK